MPTLSSLGEFGLIEHIRRRIRLDRSVRVGSGDDCAVVSYDRRRYELLTCDMLVEGVDFLRSADPYLVGRKALAVSLSDIAACAGVPRHALVAMGIPRRLKLAAVDALAQGITDCAHEYGVNVVGGDISRADKLVIDVSMTGLVEKTRLTLRRGALPGDIILVTGPLGGSIRGRHCTFTPRVREARALTVAASVHAMMDISDGLSQDLGHICRAGNVGAVLYEELIPLSDAARSLDEALTMGEDFELLVCVGRADAKRLTRRFPLWCLPVGEVVHRRYGISLIDRAGRRRTLAAAGFRHF